MALIVEVVSPNRGTRPVGGGPCHPPGGRSMGCGLGTGAGLLPLLILGAEPGVVLDGHVRRLLGGLRLLRDVIWLGQAALDRYVRLGCRHAVIVPPTVSACLLTGRFESSRAEALRPVGPSARGQARPYDGEIAGPCLMGRGARSGERDHSRAGAPEGGRDPAQVVEEAGDGVDAATTTSHASPPSQAAVKTDSLPMNTAVGGVPTRLSRPISSAAASHGCARDSPR